MKRPMTNSHRLGDAYQIHARAEHGWHAQQQDGRPEFASGDYSPERCDPKHAELGSTVDRDQFYDKGNGKIPVSAHPTAPRT
jgi:hypothetical protein